MDSIVLPYVHDNIFFMIPGLFLTSVSSSLFDHALNVVSIISIILPTLVIYLLLRHSPECMKSYIPFILNFTIPDLLLAMELGVLVHPDPIFPFPGAYINGVLRHMGSVGGEFSMTLMFNTVGFAISAQCYCILYRYAMLMDDLRFFHIMLRPTTWIFVMLGKALFAVATTYVLHQMTLDEEGIIADMNQMYPHLVSSYEGLLVPNISGHVITYLNEQLDVFTISSMLTIFIGFFIAECFSIACVYHILKKLERKRKSFTEHTYRLHRQLTTVLAFQLATPVIFIMCPIIIGLICQLLNSGFNTTLGHLVIISLELYGVANSFITIYFVKPYRMFVLRSLNKLIMVLSCGIYTKGIIAIQKEPTSRSWHAPRMRANSVNPVLFKKRSYEHRMSLF